MKRKVVKLRLSPNEEARIIREEHERRRKLRIQQVREQQRCISLQIRREVEQRRKRELEQLEEELREEWERQQREKLQTLQRLYHESLQLIGEGHRSAKENEPDLAAIAQREEENHVKAEERYREALKELKLQRLKDRERQSRSVHARKKALQAEKERAAKVASLPPPLPNPIQSIDSKKPHVVKKSDVSAFAATHYHMPESTVDREVDTKQPDAHEGAELEARRLQDLQREDTRRREEQLEKARLRGKEALRREHLVQDRERLLVELEHMQQTDLLRRRQQVSQMPPQIFQPLYKRQETREEFQREMEFAFEDMYTGERRVKGDLVVQLVPEPLPAPSTGSQDQELDVTLEEIDTQETGSTQHDTRQDTSAQEEPSRPAPRRALKKLLDRIRSQRKHWTEHSSSDVPAAHSPTAITDQIPERDTTIDTGSLTSEEKNIQFPEPVLETTEPSPAADTPLPDVLASRIREFEEERKKREEELEREKQQQVVLLQELEEQKARLEQMLLEAQQEREDLKAAVTQKEPIINQPEVPVHDHVVTPVTPGLVTQLVPPAGDDGHTTRIKEYQQRLLEQNRIHQRSVEVARQRLEEYQRALRLRHHMTASALLPPVLPSGLTHPPVHSAPPGHLPAPQQLPTTRATPAVREYIHAKSHTPVEVPTREADMSASPPRIPGSSISTRGDVTAWLTDNIMERVTEHLTERVRPPSQPYKLSTKPHSTSDPVRAINPSTTHEAPLVPAHASVKPQNGSPRSRKDDDTERQRRELQEAQRKMLEAQRKMQEQREAVALQQRQQEEEKQRRELQEAQRKMQEQRQQEEEKQRRELQEAQRKMQEQRQQEEEKQRRELQEAQRKMQEQRAAVTLQQRQQEEQRQRQEVEMEQMRRQKEMLQALIHTDAQPVPEPASEVLVSDDIRQTRLELLASLLRAIEESNGGTLSHLEDPPQLPSISDETDLTSQSNVPVGPARASSGLPPPPPRAAKPPVTRVRPGIMGMMTEQHELSAIQEVETPANTSLQPGLEESVMAPSHTVEAQEDPESSDTTLQTPSWCSSGQRTAEQSNSSERSEPGCLIWRERLLLGAGTPPESSESDSVLRRMSPLSSDSGRGADYFGPAVTSYRSPTESAQRPPDSDWLSSTSISTGSYITTDPEQNVNTDKSTPLRHSAEPLSVSSPSAQSSCVEDRSPAGRPALAVDALFNDSSIQHIIDRYTKELNISLSTAGRTTDSDSSHVEEPGSSVSQQSLVEVSERRAEDDRSLSSAAAAAPALEWDNTVNPTLEHFSGEDQDSFRPLIGQLADQSSCLAADQRDSAMEQLVGQPSAHSSMIGHPPGPPASVSLDQSGWDSTLSRMIGRLSLQSSSHWLSGGQDFYAGQLMGQMSSEQSSTWFDEGSEGSRMRPLVGELDESAGQHSGSSDERTHMVALGVSAEAGGPSYPALPPEASSHSASVPGVNPQDQTLQNQTSSVELGPERTEACAGSDSFHPLLAELTHNETADPSMTFHLPEHHVPTSPEEQPASGEHSVSTPSETHTDLSAESEASPERLRAEEPSSPAWLGSFSQFLTSQHLPHQSVLTVSQPTALSLSNLTVCDDDTPDVGLPQPEDADRSRTRAFSDRILEAAGEKGILEQSEITLVSLTDTTLQDQDTTITEDEGKHPDSSSDSVSSLDETTEDKKQTQPEPAMLLEFQWGPSKGLQDVHQEKRRALLQRSSCRVEEIKAKRALAKIQPEIRAPSEAREKSRVKESQPKTKLEARHKSKRGQAEPPQTTEKPAFNKQKKPTLPPPVSDSKLKKVYEVKTCTTEQRRRDVSEMHQRTRRLYEQLDEVKHQKAVKNRQEASAQNRLKAKEFHKKTLQKLRAKQTLQ